MYKVAVPFVLDEIVRNGSEHYIKELKKTDATRVFIALGVVEEDKVKRAESFKNLAEKTAEFKAAGYEVGTWLWTFCRQAECKFTRRHFFGGNVAGMEVCGLDPDYLADEEQIMKDLAATGVDLIQFDDDFNVSIGYLDHCGYGCICDRHMQLYREILGENVSKEEFVDKVFKGGKNKYRDAWLEGNRRTLVDFSKRMRAAVDSVNPKVRLGHCAVMSNFDVDGVNGFEIAKILAGNTRPFIRLIGAPYWAEVRQFWCYTIADLISLERMQCAWCEYDDVEIFTEGDVFPRPRFNVPASHLEMFDLALRADNRTDGILRYMFDYTSKFEYDTGYVKKYIKNAPLYEMVEQNFKGKEDSGVRIYEARNKVQDIKLPEDHFVGNGYIDSLFYCPAGRLTNYNAIPAKFSGKGIGGIVFGENVKLITEQDLDTGLILDAPAAIALEEMGIDVGLKAAVVKEKGGIDSIFNPDFEYFKSFDDIAVVSPAFAVYAMELKSGAVVTSYYGDGNSTEFPSCYRYENAKGQRFAVLGFDAYKAAKPQYRNPYRQRQLFADIEWVARRKLDAYCIDNPDLYTINKKQNDELSVGLFNVSIDHVIDPVVELGETYNSAKFLNCSGELKGDKVYLSDIAPFSFAGIVLKK